MLGPVSDEITLKVFAQRTVTIQFDERMSFVIEARFLSTILLPPTMLRCKGYRTERPPKLLALSSTE
jgi:hypothetical protein